MSTMDYEKLGVFYLGRPVDPATGAVRPEPLLLASRDLCTHAVCVGMTGSGKTGLSVALLEEAAIDGIPAIVIDPKGDLGNLALTFPALDAASFGPWVDPDEAARQGLEPEAWAAKVAASWRAGLAESDQTAARVQRLREACEVSIYTPGSRVGRPLAMLRSLVAPPPGLDEEVLQERVLTAVSGLLGLLGIEADPLTSREHILLSRLVHAAWAEGQDLDLAALIGGIQKPPFSRLGVLELESFYPAKERFTLAMSLNNLLASPGAAAWTEGEPLDVARLLHSPAGKPRISILSISHLSDAQRMFVVSTLLGELVAWMRQQRGTSSLRALLFMDEIQGYFPPTANPPSKPPMLTLLKQARAFGLGVVLATQNPVDLDYKGLSNCGIWLIGRLQTERDRARLTDGLSAAGGPDKATLDRLLSATGKQVFLLHDVHRAGPELFRTRWTLSYLRGPLGREQVRALTAAEGAPSTGGPAKARAAAPSTRERGGATGARPVLPPGLEERFLQGDTEGGAYHPAVFASVKVHYASAKAGVDHWEALSLAAPFTDDGAAPDWAAAEALSAERLLPAPEGTLPFGELPPAATQKTAGAAWSKSLAAHLYQERPLCLYQSVEPRLLSRPGETAGDFQARLSLVTREARDALADRLRDKATTKLSALDARRARAEAKVAKEESQADAAVLHTAVSFGSTLLGALFGRKTFSSGNLSKAASTVKSAGRANEQRSDVERARAELLEVEQERAALEAELEAEIAALPSAPPVVTELKVAPKKADTTVERVYLLWRPA